MHHYLVALAGRAGIHALVQRRLRHQGQGICLLLGHGGRLPRFRGNVSGLARLLVEGPPRGGESLHEQCPHPRLEPPGNHDHAILIVADV